MKTWVKLYTEVLTDPKMGMLSWEDRGIWYTLLAVAGFQDERDENEEETGKLGTLDEIAWFCRIDLAQLEAALQRFAGREMVVERDGIYFVANYWKRQRKPTSSKRSLVRQRVTRHREKKREETGNECNDVTASLHSECNVFSSPSPSVSSSESSSVRERKKHTPKIPPAVRVFHENAHRFPAKSWYSDIARIVGEAPDALEFWGKVVKAWVGIGWKPTNVMGMLEFYERHEIPSGKSSARQNEPKQPPRGEVFR